MDSEAEPIPPTPVRGLPFTMDLLERDAKFGFTWFVAHGGLNTKVKRGRYKKAIMEYSAGEMWREIRTYLPQDGSQCPRAVYTGSYITMLGHGIAKLMNYKLDYFLRDSLAVVELSKRRRAPQPIELTAQVDPDDVTIPNPLDLGFVPDVDLEPPRRRRRGEGSIPVPLLPNSRQSSPEGEPEGEPEQQPRPRARRRRVIPPDATPLMTEREVLRMLTKKREELNMNPRANLILDPEFPAMYERDNGFGIPPDMEQEEQSRFLNALNGAGDHGREPQTEDVTGDPTDRERAAARTESERSPMPNVEPGQARAARRPAAAEQNSLELQPVVPVVTPRTRSRRARRLVFLDAQTTYPLAALRDNIRHNEILDLNENMRPLAKESHFWPPSEIRRRGMDMIEESGRKIVGTRMNAMMGAIRAGMPVREELRERLIVRVEGSSRNATGSALVIDVDEPSGAGAPRGIEISNVDATATRSINASRLGVSSIAGTSPVPVVRREANIAEEPGAIEISRIESPPRGSPPRGDDMGLENRDFENEIPPAEEKLLTFAELVPNGSSRALAMRVFMGLLGNQKKGYVELIQHEWCGEIKIRILKPNYNPLDSSGDITGDI